MSETTRDLSVHIATERDGYFFQNSYKCTLVSFNRHYYSVCTNIYGEVRYGYGVVSGDGIGAGADVVDSKPLACE